MTRAVPAGRVTEVARAATRVFIQRGYRRTLMADVAKALELSAGALYTYVESKDALFELALRYAMEPEQIEATGLPIPTPKPGETLALVDGWLEEQTAFPSLIAAVNHRKVTDVRAEFTAILEERYDLIARSRRLLALIEQSALDLPELSDLYYRRSRRSQIDRLATYIDRRIRSGHFGAVPDTATAARFIIETIAWFAWHRKGDPDSAMIDDDVARNTTVALLVEAFVKDRR